MLTSLKTPSRLGVRVKKKKNSVRNGWVKGIGEVVSQDMFDFFSSSAPGISLIVLLPCDSALFWIKAIKTFDLHA